MTSKFFVCIGSVRGSCGHKHKTPEAAFERLDRDREGCASQCGYSDRSIYNENNREVVFHWEGPEDDDGTWEVEL